MIPGGSTGTTGHNRRHLIAPVRRGAILVPTMSGPEFLMWYALAIAAVVWFCHWRNRRHDPWRGRPAPPLPEAPDPYRIAWLRGGGREVIRLGVYDLIWHQRLAVEDLQRKRLVPQPGDGDGEPLAPLAREILKEIAGPTDPVSLLKGRLPERIDEHCRHFAKEFADQGLLLAPALRFQAWLGALGAIAAILAVGGVRLAQTLAHGHHNVLGLIFCGLVGSVLILMLGTPRSRLTVRGRDYLRRLELAFAPNGPAAPPKRWTPATTTADEADATAAQFGLGALSPGLLPVALLGVGALEGTAFGAVPEMFPQAARQRGGDGSSGGCGTSTSCGSTTSCGSSGDSGGGGDGGGSGCGGGGCGGGGGD
jgi:uncharacterized protein (TIGR04222 family)